MENGTLIVGEGGTIKDATVVVDGPRIADAGTGVRPPSGAKDVVNCSGKTIMHGLMDCHAHLLSVQELDNQPEMEWRAMLRARDAKPLLQSGFTTGKDGWTFGYLNVKLRDAINNGWIPGPRTR